MGAIYLIRHGQASFGKKDYDSLSTTGIQQSQVLGSSLKSRIPRIDAVICGGMRRHQQTAEHCLAHMGHEAEWSVDTDWNEYDHDEIIQRYKPIYKSRALMLADLARRGNPRRDFQNMFAEAIERWMCGEHDDDYSESWPAFEQRRVTALQKLVQQLGPSKTALVFTSGGPITAICQSLMRIPSTNIFRMNWTLTNAGITKIIYSSRGIYLSSLNEHSAFEGRYSELITYR